MNWPATPTTAGSHGDRVVLPFAGGESVRLCVRDDDQLANALANLSTLSAIVAGFLVLCFTDRGLLGAFPT